MASNTDGTIGAGGGGIWPNGNEITLEDGKTPGTTKIFVGGSTTPYTIEGVTGSAEDGYDLSGYTIFCGIKSEYIETSIVNIKGGTINAIYAGTYRGGDGGRVGNAIFNISGGTIGNCCLGSGYEGAVTNSTLNISGGKIIKNIVDNDGWGADRDHPTADNKTINISGNPEIGGIIINGGTGNVATGVTAVNIVGELTGNAGDIKLVMPTGYPTGTIAVGNDDPTTVESDKYVMSKADFNKIRVGLVGLVIEQPKNLLRRSIDGSKIEIAAGIKVSGTDIYANGNEIELEAVGATNANILAGGSSEPYDLKTFWAIGGDTTNGFDLSGYTVYGGVNAALTGDTKITMTGGIVNEIFGGSNGVNLGGSTNVSISGNASISKVYGGGNYGSVKDSNITIDGGTITASVYGGGFEAGVTTSNVNITDGTIIGIVNGGGWYATVDIVNITIDGGAIMGSVYGGGYASYSLVTTANIDITGGTISDIHCSGANDGAVTTANVNISGGTLNSVYVSTWGGGNVTNKEINISGNPVIGKDDTDADNDDGIVIESVGAFNIVGKLTGTNGNIKVVLPSGYTTGTIANVKAPYSKITSDDFAKVSFIGTPYDTVKNILQLATDGSKIEIVDKSSIPTPPPAPPSVGGDTTRYYGVSDTTGNGVTPKNEDGKYTYAVDGGNFVLDNIGGMQGGKTFAITVNPNEGYVLDYIMINGEKTTDLTFTMPMKNVDIQVVFKNDTTAVPTPTPSEKPTPGVETAFPWWIVILVGAIVLFIIIIIITKKKKDNEEKHNGGNGNGNGNDANQNGNDNELK